LQYQNAGDARQVEVRATGRVIGAERLVMRVMTLGASTLRFENDRRIRQGSMARSSE